MLEGAKRADQDPSVSAEDFMLGFLTTWARLIVLKRSVILAVTHMGHEYTTLLHQQHQQH